VLSRSGFEFVDTGLLRGVLQAQPGRFPARGGGFPWAIAREEAAKLLQPVD
jgi:hypothetical protein